MKKHLNTKVKELKLTTLGFTLIELLAVIVILAIIALIAIPIILNIIEDAKKSAAQDSAYGYIEAIESHIAMSAFDNIKYPTILDGTYTKLSAFSSINIKGTRPTSINITINNSRITTGELCINNYKIKYDGTEAKVDGKCDNSGSEEEIVVLKGDPIIDKVKSLVYATPKARTLSNENNQCKTDGSTYEYMGGCYIKGANTDNYVWYNGFMWRIMGINSDGTVRLITDENVTAIPYGAANTALTYKENEGYIHDWLNDYFYSHLNSTKSIIKEGNYFCSETLTSSTGRTICTSGNEINTKIGLISIDEYLLANTSSSYLNISQSSWTMTPYSTSNAWYVSHYGDANNGSRVAVAFGVRPVINVEATSIITEGDGTSTGYYVLAEDKTASKTGTLSNNVTSGEYVKLEDKTYRVVSKDNDGVKLILDGYYTKTSSYGNSTFSASSGIGQKLNGDVLTYLGLSSSEKLVSTKWYQVIVGSTGYSYTLPLTETGTAIEAKVGLIRVGEMLSSQSSTILTQNYTTTSSYSKSKTYWTMTPYSTTYVWIMGNVGFADTRYGETNAYEVRPVIKVKNNLTINGGNGTWSNPYEI